MLFCQYCGNIDDVEMFGTAVHLGCVRLSILDKTTIIEQFLTNSVTVLFIGKCKYKDTVPNNSAPTTELFR